MPKLIVMKGSAGTKQVALLENETTIGRASSNDVVLESMQVSRRHAIVRVDGPQVSVTDLGSLNGVFVNGSKVRSRVLAGGDEIAIGNFKVRFLSGDHEVAPADDLRLITTHELLADIDRTRETSPARV
jgi:pSer/pThr/pTyr-binding forkhead associated (FHA) protein